MKSLILLLRRAHAFLALHLGLGSLAAGCLLWTAVALPLNLLLPRQGGIRLGRRIAMLGFRLYLWWLRRLGIGHFDLRALDALREAGPLIIAPNHPGLLDALMVISRLPNVACVLKASLLDNPLWGAGARLAGYVRNDWFIGSINLAVEQLRAGSQLLLFPEGTRTETPPVLNPFRAGTGYVAHRAGVPIQTVIIEQDTRFLGKGWPLFRPPVMPMHFRVRLGQRFAPPDDPVAFTAELQDYFAREMRSPPLPD
ncbi:lysophospholipid acyltransferase family protein [Uliginosibacterium aquaticum]|uniref:1-acyl-sn-glycerol-3-phosphate acyltransferase n=1 Tax=Uliginosibacterium aquaticum TaxID=2731212 RepID=A0ABX2IHG0_9RHOO|nr:lysophospholipid acyltransferase family protein [Uliginosibacterium aquaticum]NSL56204.1 1-acyl-sn-glycerol-3-phosphate acyltransferase [Uliginosibacterium aquaticum]